MKRMYGQNKLSLNKIKEFLKEDLRYGDITSQAIIPHNKKAKARIFFREKGVVSGLEETKMLFEVLDCDVNQLVLDGSDAEPEQTLLEIEGFAKDILAGERTALNIVGRMSGIATLTAKTIQKAQKVAPDVRIAATRKTLPGLRNLDKKAVTHGGGDTHRLGLDDCVLIKDNHLKLVPSITNAVKLVKEKVSFTKKIEVEVKSCVEAEEAARSKADIIMFDNISPVEMKKCLSHLEKLGLRDSVIYEASGGITPDNIADFTASGVDVISLGFLTHSVRSLNVKLDVRLK